MGVLSYADRTDAIEHAYMLWMGKSYDSNYKGSELFLKMHGRKLYEYALRIVPLVVKESLDKKGLSLKDVRSVLMHQANAKMDEAILRRLYKLYGVKEIPPYVMPMTISWLGNSSVATLPTLLDLLLKGNLKNHCLKKGRYYCICFCRGWYECKCSGLYDVAIKALGPGLPCETCEKGIRAHCQ